MKHRYFIVFYNYAVPHSAVGFGFTTFSSQGKKSAPYLEQNSTLAQIREQLSKKEQIKGAQVVVTGINELSEADYNDWIKESANADA